MNRFNYPFTRILTQLWTIKNTHSLDLQQITDRMSEDKYLHKKKTLRHFLPDSEGKTIFGYGEEIWYVIEEVTSDKIKITAVQKDNSLYSLFAFIGFGILMCVFISGFRRFAYAFFFFCLMIYGILYLGKKMGDSRVKVKLEELQKSLNQG